MLYSILIQIANPGQTVSTPHEIMYDVWQVSPVRNTSSCSLSFTLLLRKQHLENIGNLLQSTLLLRGFHDSRSLHTCTLASKVTKGTDEWLRYRVFVAARFKANSHITCRSLPCLAAKGLECAFPAWFTECGRVSLTHVLPRPYHATTMPFWKRLLKVTTQRGMAWHVWINIGRPQTCVRPTRVRLLPTTTRSSTKVVIRSIPIR
jgi:hypothetical protein